MEVHMAYTFRFPDETVYRMVKARAALEGKTMNEVMIELLTGYAQPMPQQNRQFMA